MAPTSFVYPRTIKVTRPPAQSGVGAQAYGALARSGETAVVSDVAASIQARNVSKPNHVDLPADGKMSVWDIYISRGECQRKQIGAGDILSRDWITDDAGERYQVLTNYWDSLGFKLTCEKQEA